MEGNAQGRMARFLKSWGPPVVWGMVIFAASTDIGSNTHTSRILVPLLKWLVPGISPEATHLAQVMVRKCAHLSEYGILAMLIWRGWRLHRGAGWSWAWREMPYIVCVCALYAASDEFHQSFVSSRESSLRDVLIDSCGAAAGLVVLWAGFRLWRRMQAREPSAA